MDIVIGPVVLEEEWTAFRERIEELGGRNARTVVVTGLVTELESLEAIEARLDEIVEAASQEDYSAKLSVRFGRVLFVRRNAFVREVLRESLVGSFSLTLEARDPYEWSAAETVVAWDIHADPDEIAVACAGTVAALPIIELSSQTDLTQPEIGDGERTLRYDGVVASGRTLTIDSERGRVLLDDEDVTPYTTGEFPRIASSGTILTFTDANADAPSIKAEIRFRDRWW